MGNAEPLHIQAVGQKFADEPIHLNPIPEPELTASIRTIFQRRPLQRLFVGYERVRLRWLRPGPDGKLVPR